MKIKYLIFNLDDMILNSNLLVNDDCFAAIEKAQQKNFKIMAITDKDFNSLIYEIKSISNQNWAIASHGSLLFNKTKNEIIENTKPIDNNVISYFLEHIWKKEYGFIITSLNDTYCYCPNKDIQLKFENIVKNKIDLTNISERQIITFLSKLPIYSIKFYSNKVNNSKIIHNIEKTKKICHLTKTFEDQDGCLYIFSNQANKYSALQKIMELENINPDDIYLFTSSNNDSELILSLKNCIVSNDMNSNLKEKALYVVDKNDKESLVAIINKIIS